MFVTVPPLDAPVRLDSYLATLADIHSRAAAQRLIDEQFVCVNGQVAKKKMLLTGGEKLSVVLPPVQALDLVPEEVPLNIVYEDEHLLVVNKPRGMVVHPAAGHSEGTLVHALLAHCRDSLSGINGVARPGIVHRIDKDTSGLLIVAKTDVAHISLAKQIKEHSFTRMYEAIIVGNLREHSMMITGAIGRHPLQRKRMAIVSKGGKDAVTHVSELASYGQYSHVSCVLETGRTHQIRVHLASIGHSVLGDAVYGAKKNPFHLEGQCLHAKTIGFVHPISGVALQFSSELPDYFKDILKKLS